jgi:hypothetical protein
MKWTATLLSVTAAVVLLSNCADTSYAYKEFDESYNRALNDSAYNRYACQNYNHDFRYCR